ncbi:MAG: hypothetical protein WD468_08265 [Pirellulales bacterium]
MLSRRIVLSVVAVVALVLSSAGSAEARLFGGCGCQVGCGGHGGCGGGFLRNLFRGHCCMNDCGCGCESSCDSGCGCEGNGGCGGGCGCGGATESSEAAPASPEAAPAAPEKSA